MFCRAGSSLCRARGFFSALRIRIRDPGLGAFLTSGSGIRDGRKSASGSGIRDEQPGSYLLELRNHFFAFFWVKILWIWIGNTSFKKGKNSSNYRILYMRNLPHFTWVQKATVQKWCPPSAYWHRRPEPWSLWWSPTGAPACSWSCWSSPSACQTWGPRRGRTSPSGPPW